MDKRDTEKPFKEHNRGAIPKETRQMSYFATDVKAYNTGGSEEAIDERSGSTSSVQGCLCCSGSHELASCVEFEKKDLQVRWDIVKHNRLCQICLRFGHHRGKCESHTFCRCGSDKRHHELLHNPPRRFETERANQVYVKEQKPIAPNPPQESPRNDLRPTEPRSTVQYATD